MPMAIRTAWSTPASNAGLIAPAAARTMPGPARRSPAEAPCCDERRHPHGRPRASTWRSLTRAKPSASTTPHAWLYPETNCALHQQIRGLRAARELATHHRPRLPSLPMRRLAGGTIAAQLSQAAASAVSPPVIFTRGTLRRAQVLICSKNEMTAWSAVSVG